MTVKKTQIDELPLGPPLGPRACAKSSAPSHARSAFPLSYEIVNNATSGGALRRSGRSTLPRPRET